MKPLFVMIKSPSLFVEAIFATLLMVVIGYDENLISKLGE
jgi:hypothetical protein